MTITIGIATGLTGGGVFAQLPAREDIVAEYQNIVSVNDDEWIDINTVASSKNIDISGYTGDWDIVTKGVAPVSLVSGQTYTFHIAIPDGTGTEAFTYIFDYRDATHTDAALYPYLFRKYPSGDWDYDGTSVPSPPVIEDGVIKVDVVIGGTKTGLTLWGRYVNDEGMTTPSPFFKIFNSLDVLIHHWICESSPTSLQDTIYDIVSEDHATLTGATLPFFTTEIEGSKLFADGFDNVGGSDGLVPAGAATTLTNDPSEFIGEYCLFYAPTDTSFYNMAVVANIENDLYLAGDINTPIGLTADAWILLANNPLFFGATRNILVGYNAVQSGDTLDQINDYLGI